MNSSNQTKEQITIIGSGPAGLTAALYAARMGLNPLVIEGPLPGGQLMKTFLVENWPGEEKISGPELINKLRKHSESFGARFVHGSVKSITITSPFVLELNTGVILASQTVIIASGAEPRRLGCPGEEEYWGKGVSSCAICDGALFKDQAVLVVGGGNSALEYALFLSQFTKQISIIHRGTAFSATEETLKKQVEEHPDITIYFSTTLQAIEGNGKHVTGAILYNTQNNTKKNLPVSGIFLAVGSMANIAFLPKEIKRSYSGQVLVYNQTETSIPGIFSAGDVSNTAYRQAITASGTGCQAALDAQKYLKKTGILLN